MIEILTFTDYENSQIYSIFHKYLFKSLYVALLTKYDRNLEKYFYNLQCINMSKHWIFEYFPQKSMSPTEKQNRNITRIQV